MCLLDTYEIILKGGGGNLSDVLMGSEANPWGEKAVLEQEVLSLLKGLLGFLP